ncbi:hypothetical protein [Kitasatospora sp. MBT66]|uniref:hypothetical protein n=1 Tax=Kitasatospora sp. MBT66 TaxID=1444769 RepID=UPI0005BE5FAA|nr:hypothetical protein [Kitasatospora sp. MBT66]
MLVSRIRWLLNSAEGELVPAHRQVAYGDDLAERVSEILAAENAVLRLGVLGALDAVVRDAARYRADQVDRCDYLDRQAKVLHDLIDATGDEDSRWIAQDAEERADRARQAAETDARLNATPPPAPRTVTPWPHPTTTAMIAARAKARK